MSDTTGQTPTPISGQEPQTTPEAQSAEGKQPETFPAEYVRQLRAEAASNRKRAAELEAKVKADEESKLGESEKLTRRLAELEKSLTEAQTRHTERVTRYEIMLAAQKLGIVDPDAAYKLLEPGAITYDDNGQPQNVEKALRELAAKRPFLVGSNPTSPTNPGRSGAISGSFSRKQIADPEFYKANRDAIMKAVADGRITND